jgi:Ca2+-binding EF-hand superfamily protein
VSEGDIEEMFSIADQDKDGKICYQVNVEYKMDRITRFLS